MAELPQGGLSGDDAEERQSFIEGGTYNAEVINSNGGQKEGSPIYRIGLQFQVLDGPKEKATFWLGFNYLNPNSAQNQDISQNQLRLIAKAAGVGLFSNTEELHHKPVNISVKLTENNGYTNNDMVGVKPYVAGGGAAPKTPAKTTAKTPAKATATTSTEAKPGAKAGAGGGKKPWEKPKT